MPFLFQRRFHCFQIGRGFFVIESNIEPVPTFQIAQIIFTELAAFSQFFRPTGHDLPDQHALQTLERIIFNDTQLVIQIEAIALEFFVNNRLRTLVTLNTFTGKDLDINDGAGHAGINLE